MKPTHSYSHHRHHAFFVLGIDLSIVAFSFLITTWGRFDFSLHSLMVYGFQMNYYKAIGVLLIYLFALWLFKIYKINWKNTVLTEMRRIFYAVVLATSILLLGTLLVNFKTMLINIVLVSGMLSTLAMFSVRAVYQLMQKSVLEQSMKKALILGAGDAGYLLIQKLNQTREVEVVGFVDDFKIGSIIADKPVLGSIDKLPKLVSEMGIDTVYFAIPSASSALRKRVFTLLEPLQVKLKQLDAQVITMNKQDLQNGRLPIHDLSIEELLGRGEVCLDTSQLSAYLKGKTVLISGAGGSIGSELCRQIVNYEPACLLMLDINENGVYMLKQAFDQLKRTQSILPSMEILPIIGSIRERQTLDRIMEKYRPSVVFHAAAHKHVPLMEESPQEAIKNNVFGTENLLLSSIAHHVERMILISTDKAVHPTNVMGATKRLCELMMEAYRNNPTTHLAAVRFGNVLGSNGSVIPIFKEQIKAGGPITLTDREIVRYFMTIPEAAQLVLQAGAYADQGEIFVLDMGEPVKIEELAKRMIRLAGYEPGREIEIVETGLRPGEKMVEELYAESEQISRTQNDLIFVSQPMNVDRREFDRRLRLLHERFDKESDEGLKALLMELIDPQGLCEGAKITQTAVKEVSVSMAEGQSSLREPIHD